MGTGRGGESVFWYVKCLVFNQQRSHVDAKGCTLIAFSSFGAELLFGSEIVDA